MEPVRPIPALPAAPRPAPAAPGRAEAAGLPAAIGPNPRLRVDPTLNLVVLEFTSRSGEVTRSLPTERELSAYRTAQLRGDAPPHASSVSPRAAMAEAKPELPSEDRASR